MDVAVGQLCQRVKRLKFVDLVDLETNVGV
jgi:hypothetical protein